MIRVYTICIYIGSRIVDKYSVNNDGFYKDRVEIIIGVVGPFMIRSNGLYVSSCTEYYSVLVEMLPALQNKWTETKIINKNRKRMNAGNTSDIPWPGPMIHHVRISRITASPLPIFQALFLQPPTLPSSPAASLLFILTALKLLQKGIRSLLFCFRFKEQQQQQVWDRCDHEALINYRCLAQSSCPRLSRISRCPCSCVLWLLPVSDQGWG